MFSKKIWVGGSCCCKKCQGGTIFLCFIAFELTHFVLYPGLYQPHSHVYTFQWRSLFRLIVLYEMSFDAGCLNHETCFFFSKIKTAFLTFSLGIYRSMNVINNYWIKYQIYFKFINVWYKVSSYFLNMYSIKSESWSASVFYLLKSLYFLSGSFLNWNFNKRPIFFAKKGSKYVLQR